jgi:small redox-active disulfide protein 2
MKIQILGTGCPKCEKTTKIVKEVVEELGLDAEIEKVTDLNEIMTFNVMTTPAVAIDGQVKISGRVPSARALKKLLK